MIFYRRRTWSYSRLSSETFDVIVFSSDLPHDIGAVKSIIFVDVTYFVVKADSISKLLIMFHANRFNLNIEKHELIEFGVGKALN